MPGDDWGRSIVMWISQKLFLDRKSVSPDVSDYLGWRHMNVSSIVGSLLESCSSSIKPSGLLETEESVSNSRIWGKINQSFFFWSRFCRTNGYSTQEAMLNSPTLLTLREPDVRFCDIYKNNFTEVDISKGYTGRLPLCLISTWLRVFLDIRVQSKREGLTLR